jgi:predicted nucleotidyltransferase
LRVSAFLTGSHAYGTPTEASDVDLVVPCTPALAALLAKLLIGEGAPTDYGSGIRQFKVGKLNLILLSSLEFEAWRDATVRLVAMAPVSREEAVVMVKGELARRRLEARGATQEAIAEYLTEVL